MDNKIKRFDLVAKYEHLFESGRLAILDMIAKIKRICEESELLPKDEFLMQSQGDRSIVAEHCDQLLQLADQVGCCENFRQSVSSFKHDFGVTPEDYDEWRLLASFALHGFREGLISTNDMIACLRGHTQEKVNNIVRLN